MKQVDFKHQVPVANHSDKSKAQLIAFAFDGRDIGDFEETMCRWDANGEDWIGWLKVEGIIDYEAAE